MIELPVTLTSTGGGVATTVVAHRMDMALSAMCKEG